MQRRLLQRCLTDLNGDGKFDGDDLKLAAEKAGIGWDKLDPDIKTATVSRSGGVSLTWKKVGGDVGAKTDTVAGVYDGEIHAICEDGTRVQGTFVIGSGTPSGTGFATDTNGNVYELLF